jgi:hypothetical protein
LLWPQNNDAAADSIGATVLLRLAKADAEGGLALDIGGGGRLETARRLDERSTQHEVVGAATATTDAQQSVHPMLMQLVRTRRLLGLALLDETHEDLWSDVMAMLQECIVGLDCINVQENHWGCENATCVDPADSASLRCALRSVPTRLNRSTFE